MPGRHEVPERSGPFSGAAGPGLTVLLAVTIPLAVA